jgi:hypothetical protein
MLLPLKFITAVLKHWGIIVTSGIVIGLLSLWQNTGHGVPHSVYWSVAVIGLLTAFYRTWLDQYKQVVKLTSERQADVATQRTDVRLALYGRQLAVFDSTTKVIMKVLRTATVGLDDLSNLMFETRECEFIFGPDIRAYIDEIYSRCVEIYTESVTSQRDGAKFVEQMMWFSGQLEQAKTKFGKYMTFEHVV